MALPNYSLLTGPIPGTTPILATTGFPAFQPPLTATGMSPTDIFAPPLMTGNPLGGIWDPVSPDRPQTYAGIAPPFLTAETGGQIAAPTRDLPPSYRGTPGTNYADIPWGDILGFSGLDLFGIGGGGKAKAAPKSKVKVTPRKEFSFPTTPGTGTGGISVDDWNKLAQSMKDAGKVDYPADIFTVIPSFESLHPSTFQEPQIDQKAYDKAGRAVTNSYQDALNRLTAVNKWIEDLPSLEPKAAARTKAVINWQIGNIVGQQNMLRAQANTNADAMLQASSAAADLQTKIGAVVRGDYAGLGQAVGALGGAVAAGATAPTAQLLAGRPAGDQVVGGVTAGSLVPGIQGALTALQGTIPAQGIAAQTGPSADFAAQGANLILGAGNQAAMGARAAGAQQAAALEPQILSAQNQFPTLEAQTLDTLTQERNQTIDRVMTNLKTSSDISIARAQTALDQQKDARTWALSLAQMHNSWNQAYDAAKTDYAIQTAGISSTDTRANATARAHAEDVAYAKQQDAFKQWVTFQGLRAAPGKSLDKTVQDMFGKAMKYYGGTVHTSTVRGVPKTTRSGQIGISRAWELLTRQFQSFLASNGTAGWQTLLDLLTTVYKVPGWNLTDVKYGYHLNKDGTKVRPPAYSSPITGAGTGGEATGSTTSYTSGGSSPFDTSKWPATATLAYNEALKAGLSPQQAMDFAGAQKGESGFDPNARNKSSGAAGLYQLLSAGYVNKANQLGGVFNPLANIRAILPDYVAYYRNHPNASPGEAAAAVERSGKGADYYAPGTSYLQGLAGTGGFTNAGSQGQLVSFQGSTNELEPDFMAKVNAAAAAVGASAVVINSGYRSPEHNKDVGGASDSNHMYGRAMDGYAVINGQKVPLGVALAPVAKKFGLRSGTTFLYHGSPDYAHVDDGYNVNGYHPLQPQGGVI